MSRQLFSSKSGSKKFALLGLILGLCILGGGVAWLYCDGCCLFRLPHFSSDQSYVLAFVRSTEADRFAFVSPEDRKIVVSPATSELISGSNGVIFIGPCNFGLGAACFYGHPRASPENKYVYRWQLQDDTVTELVESRGLGIPIGVTAEAVYYLRSKNNLSRITFGGQESLVANLDDNLECRSAEISPNGRYVAFLCFQEAAIWDADVRTEKDGNRVLLVDLSDNGLRQLTEPGYIYLGSAARMVSLSLAWSPDSTQIAYFTSNDPSTLATQGPTDLKGAAYDNPGSIYSVDLNGAVHSWGRQVNIGVRYFSWSPDNNYLVYNALGSPRLISRDNKSRRFNDGGDKISWSPDGAYIAVLDFDATLQVLATSDYRWYAVAEGVEDFTWVRMK